MRVRILVDDADAELPRILETLDGADVRSAHLPWASLDEVFFRLMRGPQAMDPDRALGWRVPPRRRARKGLPGRVDVYRRQREENLDGRERT